MRILGVDVKWSEPSSPPLEERSLEQVTDLGIAFDMAVDRITGIEDTSIPALYRGFQLLTDTVASLPMRQLVGSTIDLETPRLLTAPNPLETYVSTMRRIMSSLLFRGNAYIWPRTREAGTGIITSCYVLNPDEVTVTPDSRNLYPVYHWRGQPMEPDKQIIHIPLNLWPGRYVGVSPITAARIMLAGAKAEQGLAFRLADDDATPSGLLTYPGQLNQAEAEAIQERWVERHGDRKRPAILSGGVAFEPLTFTPVDAQFLESRQFSVQEIARVLGLHGFFLLVDSGSSLTYSTTESLFRLFLTMTLRPTYLEPIEQAFTRMLPTGSRAKFATDEILQADITSRYAAYEIGLAAGFLTRNEVRELEGLTALAGGDELTMTERPARSPAPAPTGGGS